ncbi:MAG TPA: NAD(+)/NADH kinase [Bacteroidales bacterium]|nr:NAD(+)/NADH kinase [Bacteroidales bacterium]
MNSIALFGSTISEDVYPAIYNIIQKLQQANYTLQIYAPFYKKLSEHYTFPTITTFTNATEIQATYILSLGGDGTFLKCAHTCYTSGIPMLGINLGKLGFLAEVMPRQIEECINDLQNKKYSICNRSILEFTNTNNYIQGIGLNEITLQRSNHLKLLKISITINNDFLCSYWADGVIVSTPTGSTGYSLSLGGPIITPDSKTFVITPIAPHTLNVRPIIVPDSSIITIKAHGEFTDFLISNDFTSSICKDSPEITIKKSEHTIQTIQFEHISFFDTLRSKLQLGIDVRK